MLKSRWNPRTAAKVWMQYERHFAAHSNLDRPKIWPNVPNATQIISTHNTTSNTWLKRVYLKSNEIGSIRWIDLSSIEDVSARERISRSSQRYLRNLPALSHFHYSHPPVGKNKKPKYRYNQRRYGDGADGRNLDDFQNTVEFVGFRWQKAGNIGEIIAKFLHFCGQFSKLDNDLQRWNTVSVRWPKSVKVMQVWLYLGTGRSCRAGPLLQKRRNPNWQTSISSIISAT